MEDLLFDLQPALEILVEGFQPLDEILLVGREEFPPGRQGREVRGDPLLAFLIRHGGLSELNN